MRKKPFINIIPDKIETNSRILENELEILYRKLTNIWKNNKKSIEEELYGESLKKNIYEKMVKFLTRQLRSQNDPCPDFANLISFISIQIALSTQRI